MRIGKSAAILLMIAEGLHKNGFLDDGIHEIYVKRYTRPLMGIIAKNREERFRADPATVRCDYGSGNLRCRRLGTVKLQKDGKRLSSCPEHLDDFQKFGFKEVREE